jgi:CRP/FNR family cyclic AMP-dependent transcriptional regulator
VELFLHLAGLGKSKANFKAKDAIFTQGDKVSKVFYIQKDGVKLIVVNQLGREAIMAILGSADFLGQGCLTNHPISIARAVCPVPTTLIVVNKKKKRK